MSASFLTLDFALLVPAAFPALALAHFVALLSPGPDFFLVIGHAVRHRLRGSVGICAGIALGNALYILLAVAGWSALSQSPVLFRCMEWAGAVYLIWMGWMLLRSSRQPFDLTTQETMSLSLPRQFMAGMASALLNPKNAVFYLTLMTVILGAEATLTQQTFSGIWMTLLVLVWDTGLAACISLPGVQRVLSRHIPLIERIAGCVLILLAVLLVIMPLFAGSAGPE